MHLWGLRFMYLSEQIYCSAAFLEYGNCTKGHKTYSGIGRFILWRETETFRPSISSARLKCDYLI